MSLQIYKDFGFKLFLCKSDKSPDVLTSWHDENEHLSLEKAEEFQKIGRMIGAKIPENIVIIDLDRHPDSPDGVKRFQEIKKEFGIDFSFLEDTFVVQTAGNGFHVFFQVPEDHPYTQGEKTGGIDLKTSKGYVIAAGSPGYNVISNTLPIELPSELAAWLKSCQNKPKKKKQRSKKKLLDINILEAILDKIDPLKYNNNDIWLEFCMSVVATAGEEQKVFDLLETWSAKDPNYKSDNSIRARINSIEHDGGITAGTFISHLKRNSLPERLINEVKNLNTVMAVLIDAENQEEALPFTVNYEKLASTTEATELFHTVGNTSAARLLAKALKNKVIFVESEDKQGKFNRFYYFNGNRWERIPDIQGVIFTILFRVIKFVYQKNGGGKQIVTFVKTINTTHWKTSTLKELAYKKEIFQESVDWDSHNLVETLTTRNGVIDFAGDKMIMRKGKPEEYRKKYVDYTSEEISKAGEPKNFNKFLKRLFPDKDTLETAKYSISTFISGNASKRLFHVWHGGGFNGKSTLIEVLKKIIGDKAIVYDTKLLLPDRGSSSNSPTPEMASFQGSYVAFGVESEDNKKLSLGLVKKLTGGDTIKANPKYRDPIEFESTWQLVLATNDLPYFNASDQAFLDRLILLPFETCFYKDGEHKKELIEKGINEKKLKPRVEKKRLMESILSESPGIIRQLIKNYFELQKEKDSIIKESESCREHKKLYVYDNDDIGEFVKQLCTVELDESLFETSEALTEAYRTFSGNHKATSAFVIRSLKKHKFILKADTRKIEIYDTHVNKTITKRARGLKNIKLLSSEEIETREIPEEDKILSGEF